MLNSARFIGSIIIMVYMLTGCGGGGGGGSAAGSSPSSDDCVEFSAELDAADFLPGKNATSLAQYKIVAVPLTGYRSMVKDGSKDYTLSAFVKSNGTIYIKLFRKLYDGFTSSDVDYVLLVVDTTLPLKDSVVSFITMSDFQISKESTSMGGANSMETVMKVATSRFIGDNLYSGHLSKANGNEAKSTSSSGGKFDLTSEQLRMLAGTDDIAKSVKNDYINPDLETKVFYYWYDTNNPIDFNSLISGYSDPNDFRFDKSVISFWEQEWSAGKIGTFSAIGTKSTTVSLYPPGSSTPVTNNGTMNLNSDGDMYMDSDGDFDVSYTEEDEYRLQCCFKSITSIPASGEWKLTRKVGAGSEENIGYYDFAVGNPFVAKSTPLTSKINTIVPSIKLTVDGSNNVTQIDIKLWTCNSSTLQYEEVTDYTLLLRDDYEMGISINNGVSWIYLDDKPIDKKTYTTADFGTISLSALQRISVSINPGPFAFEFSWIKS